MSLAGTALARSPHPSSAEVSSSAAFVGRRLAVVPDTRPDPVASPDPVPGGATVIRLFPPSGGVGAVPVRLTRRGVVAVAVLVAALAAAVLTIAARSASDAATASVPARVTVHSGDTLWSLASRVAPGVDPRAEVATLVRLNQLTDPTLLPGQVLRVR